MSVEAIGRLIEARAAAVRAGDVAGTVARNAADIVTYDVVPPLRNAGAETVRSRVVRWLESYAEAPGYEIRDLEVVAGADVAFAYYMYRVSGTLRTGARVSMWVRCTVGLRKLDGEWRIVHEHDSAPFDAETGRAALDLQP